MTGVALALVDVDLTPGPSEPLGAVTLEGAGSVDTGAIVFTREAILALINILGAVDTFVPRGAGTDVPTVDGGRITHGPGVAWVAGTRIIQVAQQPSLAWSTLAEERAHTVNAGGTIEASSPSAVINVLRAVVASPSIDTDAGESTWGVGARCSILAYGWLEGTFIDVLCAVEASEGGGTRTCVRVHTIYTCGSVLAAMVVAIIYVHLTVMASKS